MIDITGLREDKRPQSSAIVHALLDRLEAAEKERDKLKELNIALCTKSNSQVIHNARLAEENDTLHAKIEAMERQEPSVPDAWLPVPEKHPTFDPVDLQLSDGSVLCGCVPQSDGDYWWEGPSGEVFIDPKYASVTHWRLAAAPEAKP